MCSVPFGLVSSFDGKLFPMAESDASGLLGLCETLVPLEVFSLQSWASHSRSRELPLWLSVCRFCLSTFWGREGATISGTFGRPFSVHIMLSGLILELPQLKRQFILGVVSVNSSSLRMITSLLLMRSFFFFQIDFLVFLGVRQGIKQTGFLSQAHSLSTAGGEGEASFLILLFFLSHMERVRVERALYLSGSRCLWTRHLPIFFSHQIFDSLFEVIDDSGGGVEQNAFAIFAGFAFLPEALCCS